MLCPGVPPTMTLRTAVVGGGTVSGKHLAALADNPRTELVAICDIDEDTAREVAADWGIDAYTDVEALLDDADLDWLHVCTPVQSHLSIAKLAIEAGVPVQIEKPITETVDEFEELAAHSERHGVPVSEVHNHNFVPAMREAVAMKRGGELGDLKGVNVVYTGSSLPDDPNRGPWNFELAGGEFEEGMPHPTYLTLRAGGYPRSEAAVSASTALYGDYDREFTYDGAQFQYVTGDGVLCSATVLGGTRPVREVKFHGTEKSVTVDLISQTLVEHDREYKASSVARALNNVDQSLDRVAGTVANVRTVLRQRGDDWETKRLVNPHHYQTDAEARALETGAEMPVPLAEAEWTVRLMAAVRSAAERADGDRVPAAIDAE
jgi:predicted dehydrogenase